MDGPDRRDIQWRALLAESWARHKALFFRIAFGIVRDHAEAQDICQMAFTKAWELRRTICADAVKLRAWLCRVVANDSLEVLRQRSVQRRVLQLEGNARSEEVPDSADEFADAQVIGRAVAKLPQMQRLVVMLRIVHGLSGEQTKELLGINAAQVSRQLYKGLKRLKELLTNSLL